MKIINHRCEWHLSCFLHCMLLLCCVDLSGEIGQPAVNSPTDSVTRSAQQHSDGHLHTQWRPSQLQSARAPRCIHTGTLYTNTHFHTNTVMDGDVGWFKYRRGNIRSRCAENNERLRNRLLPSAVIIAAPSFSADTKHLAAHPLF